MKQGARSGEERPRQMALLTSGFGNVPLVPNHFSILNESAVSSAR